MSKPVNILMLMPQNKGGATTFAYHFGVFCKLLGYPKVRLLYYAEGVKPRQMGRRFRNANFVVQTVDCVEALQLACQGQNNIVGHLYEHVSSGAYNNAVDWVFNQGFSFIIHDNRALSKRVLEQRWLIGLRDSTMQYLPTKTSLLLPMPYFPQYGGELDSIRPFKAIYIGRIAKEKGIEMIMDANAVFTPITDKIQMAGVLAMPYINFTLSRKYPHWREYYLGTHESLGKSSEQILVDYEYMVDMSFLGETNRGGTQYSILEAIDAGAVPVVNQSWIQPGWGEMIPNSNCLSVQNYTELINVLSRPAPKMDDMVGLLGRHSVQAVPKWGEVIKEIFHE